MATSRIVGGRAIDRFINIIENAVKEFEGGEDTPDELSPRTFSIAKAGGYEEIMLSDIDSFDESTDGPAVLIIDGGREKGSASTAEPGLRRLFQMMQHVRPTFSDRKTERIKAAKKKAARKKAAKKAAKKVAEQTAEHIEVDNHANGNHIEDGEHGKTKHNKTAKIGRAEFCILGGVISDSDSAADSSDNSAADSSDDSGDDSGNNSDSDRDDRPGNRKRKDDKIRVKRGPRRLIKIRNTDLYKYTDTITDEPDDDYVNDYNVAVEVDKMGLRGELLPFERARRGKARE